LFRPLLADPALRPGKGEITFTSNVFREYLKIRKSSLLFRLRTAEDVQKSVSFLNTGPQQIPGLIVMRLTDTGNFDPTYNEIVVLFNASPDIVKFTDASFKGLKFELHPVQAASADEVVKISDFDTAKGQFTIPGRTTAVFVLKGAPVVTPTPQARAATEATSVPVPTATPRAAPEAISVPAGLGALVGGFLILIAALAAYLFRRRATT
jgi:hypothetical protein